MRRRLPQVVLTFMLLFFLTNLGYSQVFFEETVLEGYGKVLEGFKEKSKTSKHQKTHKIKKINHPKLKKNHSKDSDLSLAFNTNLLIDSFGKNTFVIYNYTAFNTSIFIKSGRPDILTPLQILHHTHS